MTLSESQKWVLDHQEDIAKAFRQTIEPDRLFFAAYDTLEEMREDFCEFADATQPYIKKVIEKWVIQFA
ncbi:MULTISPECIES: hypothetical protein [Caproicibacterium]|uniref:Uncharacterized protein n=1 Tax=Caproicibacterium argilliputei TaxID=3030016 RepID=A0AA97D9Y5_9FIRM|nr:hypothetical protein [Caproicibacterium argilliputei]WOC32352.1 hypothetical protein PXC00_00360 [Caproicibacterium argilliputei]